VVEAHARSGYLTKAGAVIAALGLWNGDGKGVLALIVEGVFGGGCYSLWNGSAAACYFNRLAKDWWVSGRCGSSWAVCLGWACLGIWEKNGAGLFDKLCGLIAFGKGKTGREKRAVESGAAWFGGAFFVISQTMYASLSLVWCIYR
jgi:hypothetical protein